MKGRTPWYPCGVAPVRNGEYECHVRIARGAYVRMNLPWDGRGFLVPFPLSVLHWRGLTKKAHDAAKGKP